MLSVTDWVRLTSLAQNAGNDVSGNSALAYVIHQLTNDKREVSDSEISDEENKLDAPVRLSFRLCMANTLISACQKISDSGKKSFARIILPNLIRSVEVFLLFVDYLCPPPPKTKHTPENNFFFFMFLFCR